MSIRAINWVIEDFVDVDPKKVTPTMRHILIILANFAGDEDSSYPRQNTIARITGYSRPCVNKNLSLMEEMGLITSAGRKHANGATRSSEYTLRIAAANKYDGPPPEGGVTDDDTRGVTQDDRGVAQKDSACNRRSHGGVNEDDTLNHHLDPPQEPKQEPKRPRKTAPWPSDYREQFWSLYPKRKNTSKKAALDKLAKLEREDRVEFETIMTGLRYFAERTNAEVSRDRSREQFIPHAITWINGERWETEGPADRRPPPPKRSVAI
ncbi:helix-turn-helix domain-containing protein [Bradyrhizobium ottawaense]|uniref:Helix-turn-helix domain-containing protein n=1 Tax=Bradyrhizobium ottawaense TaxID=931866 RepID=A0ABY0QHF6_9BRAD|nr:helix-turn-helix domain-containing protein [Bradyrhizobium ottawaense]SDK45235.1 Helix-turn-helix domain-containing protein [Bradyrhizobium ottawaense]